LNTAALPAATMLMMLHAIVGMECVLGRDRADDSERRVFLEGDAVVAAQAVGIQELDARGCRAGP
jgi:hypothetical protein